MAITFFTRGSHKRGLFLLVTFKEKNSEGRCLEEKTSGCFLKICTKN